MMTRSEVQPGIEPGIRGHRDRDRIGQRARLTRDVVTVRGSVRFAAGEVVFITNTWRGTFAINSTTGADRFVRRVPRAWLAFEDP